MKKLLLIPSLLGLTAAFSVADGSAYETFIRFAGVFIAIAFFALYKALEKENKQQQKH